MAEQIIPQPNGRFAVFSSITDTFLVWDATPEEIIEWRAEWAADRARQSTREELERVQAERSLLNRPYAQFTLTWGEALDLHKKHGGEAIL